MPQYYLLGIPLIFMRHLRLWYRLVKLSWFKRGFIYSWDILTYPDLWEKDATAAFVFASSLFKITGFFSFVLYFDEIVINDHFERDIFIRKFIFFNNYFTFFRY